jgi:hypothetical protein
LITADTGRFVVGATTSAGVFDISYGALVGGAWINTPSGKTGYLAQAGTGAYTWASDSHTWSISGTERMRLTSAGRLGLGTSSPSHPLHVIGGAAGNTNDANTIAVTGTNHVRLKVNTPTTGFYRASLVLSASEALSGTSNEVLLSTAGSGELRFVTGGSDRVVVDSTGRVGIGTTSPGVALHVDGDIRCDGVYGETDTNTSIQFPGSDVITFNEGGSEAARIDSSGRLLVGTSTSGTALLQVNAQASASGNSFRSSHRIADSGTGATQAVNGAPYISYCAGLSAASNVPAIVINGEDFAGGNTGLLLELNYLKSSGAVASGDRLGLIAFGGDDATNIVSAAYIAAFVDGTPGANDMPGRLVFSTTADGAATPTERIRITSAGVFQIADAGHITVGTTTGTKIGTATTQKIGFYNATPVVQPTAVADATDAASAITQLNALLTRMRNLGLIAT